VAALQLEYSLTERNIEREHIPAAQELGIGICPWSPLAGGFLTGKYQRQGDTGTGEGRLTKGSPFNKFTENNWRILEVLLDVSKQFGKSPAQVALQWVVAQPGITSTIIGASSLAQLNDNLASLDFALPEDLRKRLDEASALEPAHPYVFFGGMIQGMINGGVEVKAWKAAAGR
jgi:aryl-alcohol dehydrogenase-like predicted oxidoreductase